MLMHHILILIVQLFNLNLLKFIKADKSIVINI